MSETIQPPKLSRVHFFGPEAAEADPSKDVLGGKGYSLMTMTAAGLPVPPGFTIATSCCAEYYASGKKWPAGLDEEIRRALSWLEEVTGRALGRGPKPLLVAVRSGAAQSMPGMMDTVLNVGLHPGLEPCYPDKGRFWLDVRDFVRGFGETVCGIDFETLEKAAGEGRPEEQARRSLEAFQAAKGRPFPADPWEMLSAAVSAVFDSWNSERALKYRERHNIRGLAGTAVTVMAMFPSERSGIMFTEDPNRPDQGRILIEASYGLGEAIVRGHVEPDTFCVDRNSLKIIERRTGTGLKACVTDDQVLELAKLGLQVETFYKTPIDVEWGIAEGRRVLLQSRPVRGLDVLRAIPRVRQEEIERLRKLAAGNPKAAWVVHNLGETLPAPTPLTWDLIGRRFMVQGFAKLYRDLGFFPSSRVQSEGFLEQVAGRIYLDLERGAQLFFDQFPMEYDLGPNGQATELLLDRPTKFNVERAGAGFLLRLPWYVFAMIRAGRILRRTSRDVLRDFQERVAPRFVGYVKEARQKSLAVLPDEAVLAELDERIRVGLVEFGAESLKPGFVAGYHHGRLASTLEQVLGRDPGRELTARLLAGLEGDKTVESSIALYRVARREQSLASYLAEFGHRAVNELELAEPRWSEDPSYPLQRIRQYERVSGLSPVELHEKKKKERHAAEEEVGRLLRENGAGSLEADVRADLAGAQRHMPWRETCKHYLIFGVALVREALEVLAERWDLGRDLYFLERAELGRFPKDRAKLIEEIQARKLRWQAFQRLEVPDILRASDLEAIGREERARASEDGVFAGAGVAAGVGTGPARILRSPQDAGDIGTGYVLVCPTTDPSWTPLFIHAAGLVVERGGMLSHGAIVARDFGIPAVVLPQATRLLHEGAAVRIDGNRGRVEIVKEREAAVAAASAAGGA